MSCCCYTTLSVIDGPTLSHLFSQYPIAALLPVVTHKQTLTGTGRSVGEYLPYCGTSCVHTCTYSTPLYQETRTSNINPREIRDRYELHCKMQFQMCPVQEAHFNHVVINNVCC